MNSKAALMRVLVILGIVSLVFLAGCGGSPASNDQSVAGVTLIPSSATVQAGGVQQFAARVTPSGANQAITWSLSGADCTGASCGAIDPTGKYTAPATPPNPSTVTVTAASVADPTKAATATVRVSDNPIPTLSSFTPIGAIVGGPDFTLILGGSNFVPSSVVRWNGSNRPTAFLRSNQVSAQIPAGDIAATGTATITVFNPAPGGGTSNSVTLPIVTGLYPASVAMAPDPSGKFARFAYVANAGSTNNVSMYTVNDSTGALMFIGTIAAGKSPLFVTADPSGKFAYVVNNGSNDISMYVIDATTGALTTTGTIAAGKNPSSVTVDPSGRFAYVANWIFKHYFCPIGGPHFGAQDEPENARRPLFR